MPLSIEVLDLGLNNIGSLVNGINSTGDHKVRVINNGNESQGSDLLIIPGVGSFGAAMEELTNRDFTETIYKHHELNGRILGICLGMQLLTENSEESPGISGLGLIPGKVQKIPNSWGSKVPHVGWDGITLSNNNPLKNTGEWNTKDFYFVHSFRVVAEDPSNVLATTRLGKYDFVSAIHSENIIGFQFHPEKSSIAGKNLLSDVIEWI